MREEMRRGNEREMLIMALTRKSLKAMGLTDEQVDGVIEAHTETVEALKNQRDTYKADAEIPGCVIRVCDIVLTTS